MLLLGGLGHVGCNGAYESVAEQDAEESADEGGGDLVSDLLGRATESAHGNHDAEDRGHDAQTGKGISHRAKGSGRLSGVVMMDFHVQIEHLIQFEGIESRDRHSQGVADEVAHVVVLEESRILGKDRTLIGLFDVGFERHQSVFAGPVQQVVHGFERVDVGLLGEFRTAENAADTADDFLDDVERVGDQHRAHGSAADDQQFRGLEKYPYAAVLHQIPGGDAPKDDHDADNGKHC